MGDTYKLSATILPVDTTETLTWQSSDDKVVKIANGTTDFLKVGGATITAKISKLTATCVVTVENKPDEV